jgi:branched-chain amino acid transport system substrate-binding protein
VIAAKDFEWIRDISWFEVNVSRPKGGTPMSVRRIGWMILMALLAVTLVTSPCTAANRDFKKADTIRIGSLGPVQLSVGMGIHNAMKMAVEEINAAGGIDGKKVELFIGDTEGKPESAITAMKKLVLDDKVDAMIGTYSSGVVLAMQPYLAQYKTVFISTGAASDTLTENVAKNYKKNKYFFRLMLSSNHQEMWAAKFLKNFVHGKLGYTKFAILSENAKWLQEYTPNLRKDLEKAGLKVVFYQMFDPDLQDFSPIMATIKESGAQWIAELTSHAQSVPLVKAWADNKPCPMGLVDVKSMDSKFWEMTDGKCLGHMTYNFLVRAPITDKTIPMWDKYVKTFNTSPVYTTGFTYDAMYMLAQAIKEKKSLKSDDIIKGLENITYKGVMGDKLGFDKKDHDSGQTLNLLMVQWQEGQKQVVIYPDSAKNADYVPPTWMKK